MNLAEKYTGFYIDASRARGDLNAKFAMLDKYWEGDVNKPTSENAPGSSINIVHGNIEGQVSHLMEQNIAVNPVPVTPSDKLFADSVATMLEFIKEKNRLRRVLDIHERRREKYGTGILRVTFDTKALGGMGMPAIECVQPQAVYVDPCVTNPYKINEAQFIIERIKKSIYWARQQYGEETAGKLKPNFDPAHDSTIQDEGSAAENGWYIHLLVWTREKGKLRLVEMSGCGIIFSDSGEGFYKTGRYPYFFTPLYFREDSIYGMGECELLKPVQDLINDLDDQIRINARLTGNPQRLIETGSGIDLDALTNEAGLNIPVNSINSVKNLEAPPLPPYIENRRSFAIQYEAAKVTRFSDQMMGAKQAGVKTATEALALQQAGAVSFSHKKAVLQETLSEVFSYCLDLILEFWTEEMAFRIASKKDDFVFIKPSDLIKIPKPDGTTKKAEFDIIVTVGAGMPQNKAFSYQLMMEACAAGIISKLEARKFLAEQFGLPVQMTDDGKCIEHSA